jgi:hypothetical protein
VSTYDLRFVKRNFPTNKISLIKKLKNKRAKNLLSFMAKNNAIKTNNNFKNRKIISSEVLNLPVLRFGSLPENRF